MPRSTGTTITTTTLGEKAQAFVPFPLPPAKPPLDLAALAQANAKAEEALARLNGVAALAPSVEWLVYGAVRREALLTSVIEGTQATLGDLFDAEADVAVSNPDDVEEVVNYLRAFKLAREQLHSPQGLPISVRLLCDAHRELMTGTRGKAKQPGEIRQSQNWIGGTRPGNAVHVPPPPHKLAETLSALEQFIHEKSDIPPLIRIGLIHAQFETIHPFLDGNGRIGRLLIALLLEDWKLLREPLLAISPFLKRHQREYYTRLANIRAKGDWEGWSAFFLEAVHGAARDAEITIADLAKIIASDRSRLLARPDLTPAAARFFEHLPSMPRFTALQAQSRLGYSMPTINAAIAALVDERIVTEVSGKKRGRVFSYQAYVERLVK